MSHSTSELPLLPFDGALLDRLMEEAGIDVLLVTSKHNAQYMLGGYQAMFFEHTDAVGVSRYVPIVVYPKGAPEKALYIAHRMEGHQLAVEPVWVPEVDTTCWGTLDAMQMAIGHLRKLGLADSRIGIEMSFLPMDAGQALTSVVSPDKLVDALFTLERLRAIKTPRELDMLRIASDRVVESMLAVVASHGPGTTKRELADALRREETNRGLLFEYCLLAAGTSHNRSPSDQTWERGDVLSLDSGGNYHGYIGDLARMAVLGEPDAELQDLLAEITEIQHMATRRVRSGLVGGEIYIEGEQAMRASPNAAHLHFLAHGMGLITHEAPRLTNRGPVIYPAYDATRPLQTGMILSIETTMRHPHRGFIKLEDTVAVTDDGFEIFGNQARGWIARA